MEVSCAWVGDPPLGAIQLGEGDYSTSKILYFSPPADSDGSIRLEFKITLPAPTRLQRVIICSQSRTTEIYGDSGEYIGTIKSYYLEPAEGEKEEAVLFQGNAQFATPKTCKSLNIKLLSLFRADKAAVKKIIIIGEQLSEAEVAETKAATEQKSAQGMKDILGMLAHMQQGPRIPQAAPTTQFRMPMGIPFFAPQNANRNSNEQPIQAGALDIGQIEELIDQRVAAATQKLQEDFNAQLSAVKKDYEERLQRLEQFSKYMMMQQMMQQQQRMQYFQQSQAQPHQAQPQQQSPQIQSQVQIQTTQTTTESQVQTQTQIQIQSQTESTSTTTTVPQAPSDHSQSEITAVTDSSNETEPIQNTPLKQAKEPTTTDLPTTESTTSTEPTEPQLTKTTISEESSKPTELPEHSDPIPKSNTDTDNTEATGSTEHSGSPTSTQEIETGGQLSSE